MRMQLFVILLASIAITNSAAFVKHATSRSESVDSSQRWRSIVRSEKHGAALHSPRYNAIVDSQGVLTIDKGITQDSSSSTHFLHELSGDSQLVAEDEQSKQSRFRTNLQHSRTSVGLQRKGVDAHLPEVLFAPGTSALSGALFENNVSKPPSPYSLLTESGSRNLQPKRTALFDTAVAATNTIRDDEDYEARSVLAEGTTGMAGAMIEGASPAGMANIALSVAVEYGVTAIGMVNPVLGIVATMATSLLSGLLGGGKEPDPMKELFKAVMKAVELAIKRNTIEVKMETVRNQILSISEELAWTPDLLASATEDVEASYLLMVQHDLATGARLVFGDCYDNEISDACKSWQDAGTVFPALEYAELHVSVFTSLYNCSMSRSAGWQEIVANKTKKTGEKYKGLCEQSYEVYKNHRLSHIRCDSEKVEVGSCFGYGRCQKVEEKWCQDTGSDTTWTSPRGVNVNTDSYKNARVESVTSQLENQIGNVIKKLFSFTTKEFRAPTTERPTTTTTTIDKTVQQVQEIQQRLAQKVADSEKEIQTLRDEIQTLRAGSTPPATGCSDSNTEIRRRFSQTCTILKDKGQCNKWGGSSARRRESGGYVKDTCSCTCGFS
eukprot:TRINITY_DN3982_c0_g1_i1.p1 TRINITY_DN3982_c0_g1~~TRINITY_DN3982_c0_g1_i1.p1  ORF type:complete len:630 (+),score=106.07 TRINITY_DN3982_c0_g1_i1:62-1891(+)